MILHGNQRGGAKDLALHLLKTENEHVDVHELRGFISDDLTGALSEAYAVSRGTKAKQFLFSLSLNPPATENVSTEDFEKAITRVEKELGLTKQPRAIVFHEKNGRRHAHAVWSRVNAVEMKAIPLPFTKLKLREISKELYIQHGWEMPRGFIDKAERDPNNFTHAQWQQARRNNQDPRKIKSALRDCWALSDTQSAFQAALKERGYMLAKGDRRGFVVLDQTCEVRSLSKWLGVRAKQLKAKLPDQGRLPSVDEAKAQIAKDMTFKLNALKEQNQTAIAQRQNEIEKKRLELVAEQKQQRENLRTAQQARWQHEVAQRQERYSKGLRGLVDLFTGKHQETKVQNERATLLAYHRDRRELDEVIFDHLEQRRNITIRVKRLDSVKENQAEVLSQDIQQYKDIQAKRRDVTDFKQKMQSRERFRGMDRER